MSEKYFNFLDSIIFNSLFFLGLMGLFIFFLQINGYPISVSLPIGLILLFIFFFKTLQFFSFPQSWGGRALLVLCLYLLTRSLFLPLSGWDSYTLYDGRARYFLQGLNYSDFVPFSKYDTVNSYYYFSYPPLTSNLHLWIYLAGLKTPMIIYSLFFIAYTCVIVYWVNRYRLPKYLQFVIISTSLFTPIIFRQIDIGYTNLPMMAFQMGAIHYLLKYYLNDKFINVFYFTLMLVFSIWTRIIEPTYYAFIAAWIFVLIRKRLNIWKIIILTLIPIVIINYARGIWIGYYKQITGFITDPGVLNINMSTKLSSLINIHNLINIIHYLWVSLIPIISIVLMPIGIIIFGIILKKPIIKIVDNPILFTWAWVVLITFAGTAYLSVNYDWWNTIPGSVLRTSIILVPLSMLAFVISYKNIFYEHKQKN